MDIKEIEGRYTGNITSILPIEKGFSSEKKYLVIGQKGEFLLRSCSMDTYERKKQEFDLMERLYRQGVKCNKPLDLFKSQNRTNLYALFGYLPGKDGQTCINEATARQQYEAGIFAGADLKKINSVAADTNTWYQRKWKKHEYYLSQYKEIGYRFDQDQKVRRFIEINYSRENSGPDMLQHDDFHLGNIIINDNKYGGILDFNRYDWGDPLHEFVKLEWFTWPVSKNFARGQIKGYFKENKVSREDCLKICVYIAMSLFATVVWTLKFFPHTMGDIEKKITSILSHYQFFEKTRPDWAR
jgi:aminoglycoside phosphotransferase (APT) family kinase protein